MSIRHRASLRTPCTDNTAHNSISELMAELYTHAFQSKTDRLPTKRTKKQFAVCRLGCAKTTVNQVSHLEAYSFIDTKLSKVIELPQLSCKGGINLSTKFAKTAVLPAHIYRLQSRC